METPVTDNKMVKINLTAARRLEKELAEDYADLVSYKTAYETKEDAEGHDSKIESILTEAKKLIDNRTKLKNLIYEANQKAGIVNLLNEVALLNKFISTQNKFTGKESQRYPYGSTNKYELELKEKFKDNLVIRTKRVQKIVQEKQDEISRLNSVTTIQVPESFIPSY